jgi:hypothetical protein
MESRAAITEVRKRHGPGHFTPLERDETRIAKDEKDFEGLRCSSKTS